jgi:Ca2+-binding RTX toxin-like protein
MATYIITTSNYADPSFWGSISESASGHTLDFTALPSWFVISVEPASSIIWIWDGSTWRAITEAGGGGFASLGSPTELHYFNEILVGDAQANLLGSDGADTLITGDGTDTIEGGLGDDSISAGGGSDNINAGGGNDIVWGGDGNDTMLGGAGNDTLSGEAGADTIDGGDGADQIQGGQGGDSIAGGAGNDFILGDGQWYTISGYASVSNGVATDLTVINSADGPIELWWIDGTGTLQFYATIQPGGTYVQPTFVDHNWILRDLDGYYLELIEGAPNQTVNYGAEGLADSIAGNGNNDTIYGQFGDDTIDGGFASDLIYGGTGNDSLRGGDGDDTIYGGDGNDTIDVGVGFDLAYGDAGNDLLIDGTTGSEASTLHGGDGNDTIQSGIGNASAQYYGGTGDDRFEDRGGDNQTYFGGTGSDTYVGLTGIGNDTIIGGEDAGDTDTDLIDLSALTTGVTVAFTGDEAGMISGSTGTLTFSEIEEIQLGAGNDTVNASADTSGVIVDGGAGIDRFTGGSGDDIFYGGSGSDYFYSSAGSDTFYGGDGWDYAFITGTLGNHHIDLGVQDPVEANTNDWINFTFAETLDLTYTGTGGSVTNGTDTLTFNEVDGWSGTFNYGGTFDARALTDYGVGVDITGGWATLYGSAQDDIFSMNGADDRWVDGGAGNDYIAGDGGNDSFDGGADNDILEGWGGNDSLIGGAGDDTLYGGAGDDTLIGGADNDISYGGDGADTFIYTQGEGVDTIIGGEGARTLTRCNWSTRSLAVLGPRSPIPRRSRATSASTWAVAHSPRSRSSGAPHRATPFLGGAATTGFVAYGEGGFDFMQGGSGDDTLYGGTGGDSMLGGAGADLLYGDGDNDTLRGDAGNDTLFGGLGNDSLFGGGDNDQLFGGDGNDTLIGDAGNDTLDGGIGDDSLVGGDGDDELIGGDGDDFINAMTGNDILFGGLGNDVLWGGSGNDTIYGGDGNDSIHAGFGDDSVFAGAGNDTVAGADGHDTIDAGDGNDSVTGGTGNDIVFGGAGDDTLRGDEGDDTLYGGTDNDTLQGGAGNDLLFGGDGSDTAVFTGVVTDYSFSLGGAGQLIVTDGVAGRDGQDTIEGFEYVTFNGVTYHLVTGDDGGNIALQGPDDGTPTLIIAHGGNDWGIGQDTSDVMFGGAGDDTLEGGNGDDTLIGEGGNDLLRGDGGNDQLFGGDGNDTLEGGDGNDTIHGGDGDDILAGGPGNDVVFGGAGNDVVFVNDDDGSTSVFGGDETDTLVFGNTLGPHGVSVSWQNLDGGTFTYYGTGTTGTFEGFEAVIGTEHADFIGANDALSGVVIDGMGGDDRIEGGEGDDYIDGGEGDDTIESGAGNDTVYGGDGNDTIDGGDGNDELYGDAGNDAIWASSGDDTIYGGDGNDTIGAESGNDLAFGGAGDDSIFGGGGNDTLVGGEGQDYLAGGDGDDLIHAGPGNDTVTGGAGNDTFVFNPGDGLLAITDFNTGNTGTLNDGDTTNNDFIDLSGFYDNIAELHDDLADDGVLNQSNEGNVVWGQAVTYSDNTLFAPGDGIVFDGQTADGNSFTLENTGVICFTPGTLILTEKGERPVEALRRGDRIVTRDNGVQPLRWLARRKITRAELEANERLHPVLIQPDLIGASAPLLVSPQHGVLVRPEGRDEVLVRATHLARVAGGKARIARGIRQLTYIHLMFDAHQIVFANGAPSESFYPGPMALGALAEPARAELRLIFPDLFTSPPDRTFGPRARHFAHARDLPPKLRALRAA